MAHLKDKSNAVSVKKSTYNVVVAPSRRPVRKEREQNPFLTKDGREQLNPKSLTLPVHLRPDTLEEQVARLVRYPDYGSLEGRWDYEDPNPNHFTDDDEIDGDDDYHITDRLSVHEVRYSQLLQLQREQREEGREARLEARELASAPAPTPLATPQTNASETPE